MATNGHDRARQASAGQAETRQAIATIDAEITREAAVIMLLRAELETRERAVGLLQQQRRVLLGGW